MPKNHNHTILIVEDDSDIASLERDYLEMANYTVDLATSGEAAKKLIYTHDYSLIILDVMLPGVSGYDLCKQIRAFSDVPIILVTAKSEPTDVIRGLGLGSDDYITKPFDPAILVARVKSSIDSYERHKHISDEITVGNLRIIPANFQVFKNDQEVKLPNKEFELLVHLATNPNIVISKENLFEAVWGLNSDALEATVTVHINRIRDKIEDDPTHPQIIETIWGAGYRFNLD